MTADPAAATSRLLDLEALAALNTRGVRVPLGPGPAPEDVLCRLADSRRRVCLTGVWADGAAVVACEPLVVVDGADAMRALGVQPTVSAPSDVRVGGGWLGWLAYDGNHRVAFYDHVLVHEAGEWFFEAVVAPERDAAIRLGRARAADVLASAPVRPSWRVGEFAGADRDVHLEAVERAVAEIRAGSIYQANVCTRLSAEFAGDAAGLFATAVAALRPSYGAFVDGGDRAVVGLSPELFLRRRGREVTSSPIKGTRPRTAEGHDELRRSVKDAAENVMIVDLVRNDLGRVCETGSVVVESLLDVQPHPGVWHLVSTVHGRVRDNVDDTALLAATFPPGSVTGAPKHRAQQVIADVEACGRGAYTGAVGIAGPVAGLELTVTIRSFEVTSGRVELGVGGGITADSVPAAEWQECLHKAAPLLAAVDARLAPDVAVDVRAPTPVHRSSGVFETVLVRAGAALRLEAHLARLDRSCRELYGQGLPPDITARAIAVAATAARRSALRVHARWTGRGLGIEISCAEIGPPPVGTAVVSCVRPDVSWRHKWADRSILAADEQRLGDPRVVTPLYVSADGRVLETSRGNVFLACADGSLVTPPLGDDVLPGVTRAAVLDHAYDTGRRVRLRPVRLQELRSAAAFWTSSLSGVVAITSVDGVTLPGADDVLGELRSAVGGAPLDC